MNRLIVLMGTTGVGKTAVAQALVKKGYSHLSFDEMIRQKSKPVASVKDLRLAYTEFGHRTDELLRKGNVVVDEWFYLNHSFEWFKSQITGYTVEMVCFFQLDANLKAILERNEKKKPPIPVATVRKHYKLTKTSPGKYYRENDPYVVETTGRHIGSIVEEILGHISIMHFARAVQSTRDYPIHEG